MCRLRVGHTWLTQSYLLKNEEQPFCNACDSLYTVRHTLIECPDFQAPGVTDLYYFSERSIPIAYSHLKKYLSVETKLSGCRIKVSIGSSVLLQAAHRKSVLKMPRHWLMMLLLGLAMLVWSSDEAAVTGLQRKTRQWFVPAYPSYYRTDNLSPQQFRQDAIPWMVTHMYVQLSASISPAISSSLMRFDDKPTTSVRRVKDVFPPIRVLWDFFHTNLTRYFVPGQNITVDEQFGFLYGQIHIHSVHAIQPR
ncbi:tick transposon [Plakobranchus ocellatus]|uniref:Tick transposon n=1 Tax=Plakobranchus ocellatus TaxID=259542 RepID=A0AAV3YAM4_9GAST|nr:tick transposon [Plakobranchus ocellatus]